MKHIRKNNRRLVVEPLEIRNLMAADCQNFFAPLDVNDDSAVTASDALKIINRLNAGMHSVVDDPVTEGFVDVSGDDVVGPSDAIQVINWLNTKGSNSRPDAGWTRITGADNQRVGVKLQHLDDGSLELEVRLQNASNNDSHDIFINDQWIGSVNTDSRGRGKLTLQGNKDLANRLPELLLDGQSAASIVVDSVGTLDLRAEAEKSPLRSEQNQLIAQRNVFVTALNSTAGEHRGEAIFGSRDSDGFLSIFARGLTSGESYDISIDGSLVTSRAANAAGVIAARIKTSEIENFPAVQSGTKITVGQYSGQFQTLQDRLKIPQSVYLANFIGRGLFGGAELEINNDRTVIRLLLGRVAKEATFDLLIDGVKIAEVTSSARGLIEYHFDSKSGDSLLNPIPTLTSDSVISVGTVATAKLIKLGRK